MSDDQLSALNQFVAEGNKRVDVRSEEHTSELQSQSTISYAVFCLKKKKKIYIYIKNVKTSRSDWADSHTSYRQGDRHR